MSSKIDGDRNVVAGRDVYLLRDADTQKKFDSISEVFTDIDNAFINIIPDGCIVRHERRVAFSSESLFESLVQIGIPASVAIDVPKIALAFLEFDKNELSGFTDVSAGMLKSAVLRSLTGLPDALDKASQAQVSTWCAAYVRKYGKDNEFLKIIDMGREEDLNYDYLRGNLLPHLFENILKLKRGEDPLQKYSDIFTNLVLERMEKEIMEFANSLNLYYIKYKTFFNLLKEILMQPPHPWVINEDTKDEVFGYNVDRTRYHLGIINSEQARRHPDLFLPSARECAAHAAATILTHYGCFLGVESRYGLLELIRILEIKKDKKNILMWDYCELDSIIENLSRNGRNLRTTILFLQRLHSRLGSGIASTEEGVAIIENCNELARIATELTAVKFA